MKYKSIAIPAIGLCLVAAACSTKLDHVPERYLPVYETFSEAPSYRITFPKEDIMDVPSEAVHVIRAPEGADYETGLGWMAVPLADSILVVTQQNTIKSIDSSTGKLLNEYSFVGHGPGEYQFISNLQVTDDHIIFYYSNWFAKQRFLAVLEKGSDNRWQYRGSYRFYKESGDLFNIGDLSYSEPWLYLSSNFESDILRISIKELIAWPATSIAHNEE